ncbi:hypothetical protein [Thiorhodovibrio winogradskyi]|nr:hypothetical protein [Thiorhodovibrio winogradskyi]
MMAILPDMGVVLVAVQPDFAVRACCNAVLLAGAISVELVEINV